MRIIDLLNKIANGEELPKQIKWDGKVWNLKDFTFIFGKKHNAIDYTTTNDNEAKIYLFADCLHGCLILNNEVEVIEDNKKIKELKLNNSDVWTGETNEERIVNKRNEIIGVLNDKD